VKVKPNDWLNIKTMEFSYGIDVLSEGQWCHAADSNGPLFYKTAKERDAKLKELKKQ
jgi:hypothetical protein